MREEYPDLPFVLYTGKGSEEVASEAISAGVTDYLQTESGTDQYAVLVNRIVNAVEHYRSQRELTWRNRELRRYERLVEDLPVGVFRTTDEGELVSMNETLVDIYGADSKASLREAGAWWIHNFTVDESPWMETDVDHGMSPCVTPVPA